jgi:pyrroline-5-carboxylate reductase
MTHTYRFGFLGAGNMANALFSGMIKSGVRPEDVIVSDVNGDALERAHTAYGVAIAHHNRAIVEGADVTFLCVKPNKIREVLAEVAPGVTPSSLLISIAAGVTIATIESLIPPKSRVIRAMPNASACVHASATAIAAGTHATADDMRLAETCFASVGYNVVVEEHLMNAVTGLSGSGPAYLMLVIESLADGGVKMGLPRKTALTLAAQTVLGAGKWVLESGLHPAQIKDIVASPGGTTIAGLAVLEQSAARGAFVDAVQAATERADDLSTPATHK